MKRIEIEWNEWMDLMKRMSYELQKSKRLTVNSDYNDDDMILLRLNRKMLSV